MIENSEFHQNYSLTTPPDRVALPGSRPRSPSTPKAPGYEDRRAKGQSPVEAEEGRAGLWIGIRVWSWCSKGNVQQHDQKDDQKSQVSHSNVKR